MTQRKPWWLVLFLLVVSVALAACKPEVIIETVTVVKTVRETVMVTKEVPSTPIIQVVTPTPEPTPTPMPLDRTLVVCMGQEPDTLYYYAGTNLLAMQSVLEAVYDGPIDNRSFAYQPVILEELPTLTNGSAVIEVVEVKAGDVIVDDGGVPTTLQAGVMYRPTGCRSSNCAVEYGGEEVVRMDRLVVTFKLLPGLLWSDGAPLTAYDSVYGFQLSADPETPQSKYLVYRTQAYEALDDLTAVWTGKAGYMDTTYYVNFWTPAPQHIWGQFTAAELLTAEESTVKPLGWGPFVIDEWVQGDRITLSKNPNYFRSAEGLPNFEHLVIRFVGENSNVNIAKILSGECDIVDQSAGLIEQADLLIELNTAKQLNASFVTGTVWEHADFGIVPSSYADGWRANDDRPDLFSDVRVRQAIAYCFDRQRVIDEVLFGQSAVPTTYLPPQHPLFNADAAQYPYDVDAGIQLLEEAGWRDQDGDGIREYFGENPNIPRTTPLSFNYWATSATHRQEASQILAESALNCGIEITLDYWEINEFFAEGPDGPLRGRRFDMGQFAWDAGVEPQCDLYLSSEIPGTETGWVGDNVTGFANPEYDAACSQGLQALPDEPDYAVGHQEAQRIFAEQLPIIPLYLRLKLAAARFDLTGFIVDPTAASELWNIESFAISQ